MRLNSVVIECWQGARQNWRSLLLAIIAGGLLLSTMGTWRVLAERNLGMIYVSKGVMGSAHAAPYLSKAERVFGRPQFAGLADSRRLAYLALLAMARGDWRAVGQLVPRALSSPREPDRDLAMMANGVVRALEQEGDFEPWFSIWEQLQISDPSCYLAAARRLEAKGLLQQAEAFYRQAVALAPANVEAHSALASFLELYRHDLAGTISQLEIIVKLDPTPENMLALANRLTQIGHFDEAVGLIREVQTRYPDYDDESLAIELALIALSQGDPEGAVRTLELARQRFPDSARIWQRLAATYEAVGRTEQALSAARRAIVLSPEAHWGYRQLTDILLAHNRWAEAEPYLKKAVELEKGNLPGVVSLIDLGTVYVHMGRNDLALRSFCQAQELNRWGKRAQYTEQQIEALGGCDTK